MVETAGPPILRDEVEIGVLQFCSAPRIHVISDGWPSWLVPVCALSLSLVSVSCPEKYFCYFELPEGVLRASVTSGLTNGEGSTLLRRCLDKAQKGDVILASGSAELLRILKETMGYGVGLIAHLSLHPQDFSPNKYGQELRQQAKKLAGYGLHHALIKHAAFGGATDGQHIVL